jgi:hypothetical protein
MRKNMKFFFASFKSLKKGVGSEVGSRSGSVFGFGYAPNCHGSPTLLFTRCVLGVDINTQQSFEALSERAVAVVVDPIQSVKGKVVIDAFRLINPNMMVLGQVPFFNSTPVLWIRKYF